MIIVRSRLYRALRKNIYLLLSIFLTKKANRGVMKLKFVYTLRFLLASLSDLAKNHPKGNFRETRKKFPSDQHFDLLTRKGVFPYNHVTSLDSQLPDKLKFYNSLTLQTVSDEDYAMYGIVSK